ncbi:MAG TPA: baseplate J/gp47 family protein [Thermomicrobiales bacterium]|nr:baseplate J/gp47 family protein [Thermomicrobiales bacterium]
MTDSNQARIDVGPDDGLPDLLMRIKATRGDEVFVSFDRRSGILLTAAEFRQLRLTTDQVRVDVTIATNDPLRIQLASMFGFAQVALVDPTIDEPPLEHPNWPTTPDRQTVSRSSLPIDSVMTSKPWREEPVDASAGYSVPPRPIPKPEFALAPRTGSVHKQESEARARVRPASIIAGIAALIVLVCLAGVLSIVFRTGTITVVTKRQAITTDLVVGYSTDGSQIPGAGVTLPATATEFTVPLVATGKATGTLESASGKAAGTIDLRNISGKAVTIPAGTGLQLADGIKYTTTSEVTIPRGDADKPGAATVAISAIAAGAKANRDLGMLTGPLTGFPGVYFSNISGPIAGGNDNVTLIVSQADIDQATTNAIAQLNTLAQTWELPDGRIVIPSTIVPSGEPSVVIDHNPGDQADTFGISGQATFNALSVDPNNLPDAIRVTLRNTLAQSVPTGFRLTDETIRFTNPVESANQPGLLQVSVAIDAAAILDQNTIDDIKQAAAGKSPDSAKVAIGEIAGITVDTVTVQPSLLAHSLPGADRIEVQEK